MPSVVIPNWSTSTTYTRGQVVLSGGVLYRCLVPHRNTTPPNATYWESLGDTVTPYEGDMARRLTTILAEDFAVAKTTPVVIMPAPEDGKYGIPRWLTLELVPGSVRFSDGGALQLFLGDVTEVDLPADASLYGAATAKVQFIDLTSLYTTELDLADFVAAGWRLGLKTADIANKGGVATATVTVGGTGYSVGDEGTIDTGSGTAVYEVLTAPGGIVGTVLITTAGYGYSTGAGQATTPTTGTGDSDLTVNVATLVPANGVVKAILHYAMWPTG